VVIEMGLRELLINARALLLDFDDTIVDTTTITIEAMNKTAVEMGLREITKQEFARTCLGLRFRRCFELLYPNQDFDKFFERYYQHYLNQNLELKPYALDFIERIYKDKLVAIITNRSSGTLKKDLKRLELEPYFDFFITHDIARAEKPNKAYYQHLDQILLRYGVLRNHALIIGDSVIDYLGAKENNYDFIAILNGLNSKQDFIDHGLNEDLIVDNFLCLIKAFD